MGPKKCRSKPCTLQSLTGKYRDLQGNPCNENRDPAMRTGVPCNENRVFLVVIDLQGVPCKPYRVWVCSAGHLPVSIFIKSINKRNARASHIRVTLVMEPELAELIQCRFLTII